MAAHKRIPAHLRHQDTQAGTSAQRKTERAATALLDAASVRDYPDDAPVAARPGRVADVPDLPDELLDMPSELAREIATEMQVEQRNGWTRKGSAESWHESSRVVGNGKRFALRGVIEVLEEHGLDPTVEIAKVLAAGALDDVTRAKVLLELQQYVHPKLKAVEHSGKVEIDDTQIDRRLEQLLGKAARPRGRK